MANTFDMAFTNIARRGISTFAQPVINLGVFSTDFSDEIQNGTTVETRVVPASGEPVNSSVGYDHATVAAGETMAKKSIILTEEKVVGFDITDDEILKNSGEGLTDAMARIIDLKVNKLAYNLVQFAYGKILAASYTNSITVGDKAAFDSDDVVDIATALKETYNFPIHMTNMVLNSGYAGALAKDPAVKSMEKSGLPVLTGGVPAIARLSGMAIYEGVGLPHNSQNLVGFACTPDAMAVAMRGKPASAFEGTAVPERIEVMKDPASGIVLTAYAFRISGLRKWRYTFEYWAGALATYTGSLVRLKSA